MPTVQRLRDLLWVSMQFAACSAFGAACGDRATPASGRKSTERKRAFDLARLRDHGSQLGGSEGAIAACSLVYRQRSIAEAEMLGFPVTAGAELIEEPIEEAMTWEPKESEGGGPATGYESKTRIRGAFKVESCDYYCLDPERCDGTVCTLDDGTRPSRRGAPSAPS